MGRTLSGLVLVTTLVLAGALPALGAEPEEVAEGLSFRGYFVDAGAPADINEMEQLVDAFRDVGFVALAEDPRGGADLFADAVLNLTDVDTVIVVTPGEIGYVSAVYGDGELDAAVDAAIDRFDVSVADGFRTFAGALTGAPVATTTAGAAPSLVAEEAGDETSGTSGGGGGLLVFLAIVAGVVALVVWISRRSKKQRQAAYAGRLEELKAEVRKELGTAANEILELEDRVRVAENERAQELYVAGANGYAEFQEELEAAATFEQIHELGNRVDKVLWQLEAAEALIEGRDVPPEPVPEPLPSPEREPAPTAGTERRPDLPPELDLRRERPSRIPAGGDRRGGGFGSLGGLGAIAVILRQMQQAGRSRSPTRRSRIGSSGGGGVRVPRFPGFGGGGRRGAGSTGGPSRRRAPSRGSGSRPRASRASRTRGRGRRRR